MSFEIRNEKGTRGRLTPSERRSLTYEKEPVYNLAELWEKYPEGGHEGWYCLVTKFHALYGWNEEAENWTELGRGVLSGKHDKRVGMLLRLLLPGTYTEKDGVVAGEVMLVPLEAGQFIIYESRYPRDRQTLSVEEGEEGQVVLITDEEGQWEKVILPVYDYIRLELSKYHFNRGVVTRNPNSIVFNPRPKTGDYVYWKDTGSNQPMMWIYERGVWTKTEVEMPSAELTPLTEYAKHGYSTDEKVKTVAEIEEEIKGLTDNVDGGNAFSVFGGCRGIDGGDAFTNY